MADTLAELANRYYNEGYQLRFGGARDIYVREDQALPYIKALEAKNAAQQQRIAALEAGLKPFAASYRGFMKTQTGFEIDDPFWEWLQAHADDELIGDHYQRAHDLLRSEKGGEG